MATWSEVALRKAEGAFRLDAEFWQPEYLENEAVLGALHTERLKDLCSSIRKGIFYILAEDYVDEGVPFYRSANVGDILPRENDLAYITPERDLAEFKTSLDKGDVVLAKTARIGASLIMRDRVNISQDVIGLKVRQDRIDPAYLTVFLSSPSGILQMRRWFQGQVQGHLSLPDVRNLRVPIIDREAQSAVAQLVEEASEEFQTAENCQNSAQQILERALGLNGLPAIDQLTYTASLKECLSARRLDAEFYRPRFRVISELLASEGTTLGDFVSLRKQRFDVELAGSVFPYIEIGGVGKDGLVESEDMATVDAPSRAQWIVREGDVLSSTVRPMRRLTAMITPQQDGHVASSGFAVLTPAQISAEVLVTFLRLPQVCELLDLKTTASMYPALRPADFLSVPIPLIPHVVGDEVSDLVRQGWRASEKGHQALGKARATLEGALRVRA